MSSCPQRILVPDRSARTLRALLIASTTLLLPATHAAATSDASIWSGRLGWDRNQANELRFTFTAGFRRSDFTCVDSAGAALACRSGGLPEEGDIIKPTGAGITIDFGDGKSSPALKFIVDAIDPDQDALLATAFVDTDGTVHHDYGTSGERVVRISTLKRFSALGRTPLPHVNNVGARFALEATALVGTPNRPPALVVGDQPVNALIRRCPLDSKTGCVFDLEASDPDGDSVTFGFQDAGKAGNTFKQLTPTPVLTPLGGSKLRFAWDTSGLTTPGFYSTQITLSDGIHTTAVDFVIRLTDDKPPDFVPADLCGTTRNLVLGKTSEFTIAAKDATREDVNVTLAVQGTPTGATFSTALPATASQPSTTFSWRPGLGATQASLTFTATGAGGLPSTCTITLSPAACASDDQCSDGVGCTSESCGTDGVCTDPTAKECPQGTDPCVRYTCNMKASCTDPSAPDCGCEAHEAAVCCGDCLDNDGDKAIDSMDTDCCSAPVTGSGGVPKAVRGGRAQPLVIKGHVASGYGRVPNTAASVTPTETRPSNLLLQSGDDSACFPLDPNLWSAKGKRCSLYRSSGGGVEKVQICRNRKNQVKFTVAGELGLSKREFNVPGRTLYFGAPGDSLSCAKTERPSRPRPVKPAR